MYGQPYGYGGPGSTNQVGTRSASAGGQAPPSVPSEQPKAVFRYGEQSVWSSQGIPGGTAPNADVIRLFSTPINQVGQGFSRSLSIAETNIKVAGQLPQATAIDAYGVALQVLHSSVASVDGATINQAANTPVIIGDLLSVIYNCVVTWDFTMSQWDIAPAYLIGGGGGAFGAVSTTVNATTTGHMGNGAGAFWIYNQYPVALPGLTAFALLLRFGRGTPLVSAVNGMILRGCLLGYYKNWQEIG
jgi:hypothetical protein